VYRKPCSFPNNARASPLGRRPRIAGDARPPTARRKTQKRTVRLYLRTSELRCHARAACGRGHAMRPDQNTSELCGR
jgi:hypothetical protein